MNLNELLARVGLDKKRLAELAGIGRRTLNAAIQPPGGNSRPASPRTLRALAEGLEKHARTLTTEAKALRKEATRREDKPGE